MIGICPNTDHFCVEADAAKASTSDRLFTFLDQRQYRSPGRKIVTKAGNFRFKLWSDRRVERLVSGTQIASDQENSIFVGTGRDASAIKNNHGLTFGSMDSFRWVRQCEDG